MNIGSGPAEAAWRTRVRGFVEANWPSDATAGAAGGSDPERSRSFRAAAIEGGYVYRGIPRELGGSGEPRDALREAIVSEEFHRAGVHDVLAGAREHMLVHTLLEFGSPAQRERYVPPTLACEMTWCQGYSEPGAGSDLAALTSRAVLDGGEWSIHGHKVWTSGAHASTHMFGLFRTEPDASKHGGISYLLLEMDQPGVSVRPLVQMDGGDDFNEVHFDDARTAEENTVGARGQGWQVSRATLKHERAIIGNPHWIRDQFVALLALARHSKRAGAPAIENAAVRQRLAEIAELMRCQQTASWRQLTAEVRGDPAVAGFLPIMMKLYSTDVEEKIVRLAFDLAGDAGLEAPALGPLGAPVRTRNDWVRRYLFALGSRLGGGASNIQRNIIGERGLGLPRDLRAAKR